MNKLHGIFKEYEMISEQENPNIKEASFKASKRSKKKGKKKEKEHNSNSDISKDDEEMANFVKRLNKGTIGRYKGKFKFICLIVMVLIILLKNVLIRKIRGMMKINQITNKHIKAKEQKRKLSRKTYAPKKISSHQMKMKPVTTRQQYFYSWQ